jgi:hypothetical protein
MPAHILAAFLSGPAPVPDPARRFLIIDTSTAGAVLKIYEPDSSVQTLTLPSTFTVDRSTHARWPAAFDGKERLFIAGSDSLDATIIAYMSDDLGETWYPVHNSSAVMDASPITGPILAVNWVPRPVSLVTGSRFAVSDHTLPLTMYYNFGDPTSWEVDDTSFVNAAVEGEPVKPDFGMMISHNGKFYALSQKPSDGWLFVYESVDHSINSWTIIGSVGDSFNPGDPSRGAGKLLSLSTSFLLMSAAGYYIFFNDDGTSSDVFDSNLAADISSSGNPIWDIAAGNGLYVAVRNNGDNIYFAGPDMVFTAQASGIDGVTGFKSVAFGNGEFLATANNGIIAKFTSPSDIVQFSLSGFNDGADLGYVISVRDTRSDEGDV